MGEFIVVYVVTYQSYDEDFDSFYQGVLGVYSSLERAQTYIFNRTADLDDEIRDNYSNITKNNRISHIYETTNNVKYTINEYALDMEWCRPFTKKFLEDII